MRCQLTRLIELARDCTENLAFGRVLTSKLNDDSILSLEPVGFAAGNDAVMLTLLVGQITRLIIRNYHLLE